MVMVMVMVMVMATAMGTETETETGTATEVERAVPLGFLSNRWHLWFRPQPIFHARVSCA